MSILFKVEGKMSTFGGPKDKYVGENEGLALFASEQDMANHGLRDFLISEEEAGAPGLARRLNPEKYYLACRWWDTDLKKRDLKDRWAWVENVATGVRVRARPVDSGPSYDTGRVADLSPGLAKYLDLDTDAICSVTVTDEASEFQISVDQCGGDPKIILAEEWGAVPAKLSYFPTHAAVGVVIHNTEGKNRIPFPNLADERAAACATARQIQHSHMNERGWADTGQHFTISQGGLILEGRHGSKDAAAGGQVVRGAHCLHHNDEWWGIELMGDNQQEFVVTGEQWQALKDLLQWLQAKAGKKLAVSGHNDLADTTCPGKIRPRLQELRDHLS